MGVEINIRRTKKSPFSTTISKFLEITIELNNRWQFLVTVSHHQIVDKRNFKMPKGRALTKEANGIKRSRTVVSNLIILNCMVRLNVPATNNNCTKTTYATSCFKRNIML